MDSSFCIHCGAQLKGDYEFCNNCGKPIYKEGAEAGGKPLDQEPRKQVVQPVKKQYSSPRPIHKFKQSPRRKTYSGIIIALIVVPLVTLSIIGNLKVDIGTLNFEVDSFAETNVDLVMYNAVGKTEIHYSSTILNLFEATLYVRGKPNADIANTVNFEQINDTGKIIISFDSGNYNSWSWKSFEYNIVIYIHTSAVVDYDIETSTGGTVLDLEGYDSLVMKDVKLTASTGSIQFYSGTGENIVMEDVRLQASTGTIDFDFSNAINATMNDFWSYTSTGGQDLYFGEGTLIDDISATIIASTGNVYIYIIDMIYTYNFTWDIETSTGGVEMDIIQNVEPENINVIFNVEVSTGSIDITYDVNAAIGVRVVASASTGSITLPGPGAFYETGNYLTSTSKHDFNLVASTGSIRVTEL